MTTTMLGRSRELDVVTSLIDDIHDQGSAVVVHGEAGIGKSMLLAAVAVYASAIGLTVISTIGVEAEARLPYASLHHLLRPILGFIDVLPDVQRMALTSAFGLTEGPPPEPFMIALATLSLLAEAASERAVVVVLDDIHWLDVPTQDVVTFVARRVAHDPIVVVAAFRDGHAGPFMSAGLEQLELRGLDDESSRELLAHRSPDLPPSGVSRVLRESNGNPLALVELPIALSEVARTSSDLPAQFLPLTAKLERAFASTVEDLPQLTLDAVLIAAVDQYDELHEILAAASVLAGELVTIEDLNIAAQRGLLRFDETRVSFRHPLVRSAVMHQQPVARRQAANAALAAVLLNDKYRRTCYRAQSIIGRDDDVADELEEIHTTALRRGSIDSAIWILERSAQLTNDSRRRGHRLLLAAQQAFTLGRGDLVERLIREAALTDLSELDIARMEWLGEIFNDGVPGEVTRVLELCDVAERSIAAGDTQLALDVLMAASLRGWWADTGETARERVVAVTESVEGVADPLRICVLAVADPIRCGSRVIDQLATTGLERFGDPAGLLNLGMAAHAVGDPVRAIDFLDRAESTLRDQGRLAQLSHVLTMQIIDRVEVGDWSRAALLMQEAQGVARDTGQPIWDRGTLVLSAVTLGIRGENDRAQALATEVEHAVNGQRLNDLLACAQLARGFGWISIQRYEEAYDALARLFDQHDPAFHPRERFHGLMFLAEAAVHIGRHHDANEIVRHMEQVADVTASPMLRLHLRYSRAVLADGAEAEPLYETLLSEDLIRWPWHRARAELAYGGWLRRNRRVAESRAPLRSAQSTLEQIGATGWAEQAKNELRAAGERPMGSGRRTRVDLSSQELQIAQLAAQGMSNREIGQKLFLSPRTVGSHLYRMFPKLDITSRGQLASRLSSMEL